MQTEIVLETGIEAPALLKALNASPKDWRRLEAKDAKYAVGLQRELRNYLDPWLDSGVSEWVTDAQGSRIPRHECASRRSLTDAIRDARVLCNFSLQARLEETSGPGLILALPLFAQHPDPHSEAIRVVTMMRLTGLLTRIGKCRQPKCGRYFFVKRIDEDYKYGMYCTRAHLRAISVPLDVKRQRDKEHKEKLEKVIAALEGRPMSQRERRLGWKRAASERTGFSLHRITRLEDEIFARIPRLRHEN